MSGIDRSQVDDQPGWTMLGEFRLEPPISVDQVMQAAYDAGIKHVAIVNKTLLELSLSRTIFFRRIKLILRSDSLGSTITLRGNPAQFLSMPFLTAAFALALSLFFVTFLREAIKAIGSQGEYAIPQITIAVAAALLILLINEYERSLCFLRRLPRNLPSEERLSETVFSNTLAVRKDLISALVAYLFWIPLYLCIFPSYWALTLFALGVLPLAMIFPAATYHSVATQRILILYKWSVRSIHSIGLAIISFFGTLFYFVQWFLIHYSQQNLHNQVYIPQLSSSSVGAINWILHNAGRTNSFLDLDHAMRFIFAHPVRAQLIGELFGFAVLMMNVLLFTAIVYQCLVTRFLHRRHYRKYGFSMFLGVVPEMRSWRVRIAIICCCIMGSALTLIAFWIAGIACFCFFRPNNVGILGVSIANPIQTTAVLVPFFHILGRPAFMIGILSFALPAMFILLESAIAFSREMIVAVKLWYPSKDISQLRTAWSKRLSGIDCPGMLYVSSVSLPEVRYTLLPPFRYVALPKWFQLDIIDAQDAITVLAHERHHCVYQWKRKLALKVLGLLTMRCSDIFLAFPTGEEEFEADRYASSLLGGANAKTSVERSIRRMSLVTVHSRRISKVAFILEVGEVILPTFGGFASICPTLEEREAQLWGKHNEQSTIPKRKGHFMDFAFPIIITIVAIMVLVVGLIMRQ